MRLIARLAVVGALVASIGAGSLSGLPANGAMLRRQKMLAWVNEARRKHGVAPLRMSPHVVELAHDHNLYMARINKLVHTRDLGSKLRVNWSAWGENIGVGTDPKGLYKAYMASPDHRANILSRKYDHVGINFVVRRGVMWSTMDFYG